MAKQKPQSALPPSDVSEDVVEMPVGPPDNDFIRGRLTMLTNKFYVPDGERNWPRLKQLAEELHLEIQKGGNS